MLSTKQTSVTVPPHGSSVSLDRNVAADSANLAGAVRDAMQGLRDALTGSDDLSVEIDFHTDSQRASARVRLRACRHRPPSDEE
jgi:hypothetical protein